MGSPTLSLNNGQAKTNSPATAAGNEISVTAATLAAGVSYYARAYAKTASGSVVYSAARSFGSTGTLGTFSVANNGDNTFTVTLSGGKGEQMVFYRTVNGSAVGGTHFEHKSGVLVFKEGETQKTIAVTENNPNSTYNGNAATGYSNAARTYSWSFTAPWAARLFRRVNPLLSEPYQSYQTVNRAIFGNFEIQESSFYHAHGDYDDDDRGWTSGGRTGSDIHKAEDKYYSIASLTTPEYWRALNTAEVQFRMTFEAMEESDGYQHIQIASGMRLDFRYYPYDGDWKTEKQ
ncbi:MAG: Calx-beta domain-containing protein [Clostridia bacterium]